MVTVILTLLPLAQTGRGGKPSEGAGIGLIIGAIVAVIVVLALVSLIVTRVSQRTRGGVGATRTPHRRGRVGRIWPRQR